MRLPGVLLFLGISLAMAKADITPVAGTQPVGPVFEASGLVCSCVVLAVNIVREDHRGNPPKTVLVRYASASVEVDDTFRSTVPVGSRIVVEFNEEVPATSASMPALQKGERALMFLEPSMKRTFEFADPFIGAVPFTVIPRTLGDPGMDKLQTALAAVLRIGDREDQVRAMHLLQGFPSISTETASTLASESNSSDPELAISAFAVLLKTEGCAGGNIPKLASYLRSYTGGPENESLISIGSELGQIDDPKCLTSAEELSGSKFVVIRRGAMQALRAMKNSAAAPTLVARLDDPDSYVRYLAVIALAETFGKYGDYAPNMQLFDASPDVYTGEWKAWWNDEGRNLPR